MANPWLGYTANHPVWNAAQNKNIWLDDRYYYIWEGLDAKGKESFAEAGQGYWQAMYEDVMRNKGSKAYESWQKYATEDTVHQFLPVTSWLPLHPPTLPVLPFTWSWTEWALLGGAALFALLMLLAAWELI